MSGFKRLEPPTNKLWRAGSIGSRKALPKPEWIVNEGIYPSEKIHIKSFDKGVDFAKNEMNSKYEFCYQKAKEQGRKEVFDKIDEIDEYLAKLYLPHIGQIPECFYREFYDKVWDYVKELRK